MLIIANIDSLKQYISETRIYDDDSERLRFYPTTSALSITVMDSISMAESTLVLDLM